VVLILPPKGYHTLGYPLGYFNKRIAHNEFGIEFEIELSSAWGLGNQWTGSDVGKRMTAL
jgi:hypothetical protein